MLGYSIREWDGEGGDHTLKLYIEEILPTTEFFVDNIINNKPLRGGLENPSQSILNNHSQYIHVEPNQEYFISLFDADELEVLSKYKETWFGKLSLYPTERINFFVELYELRSIESFINFFGSDDLDIGQLLAYPTERISFFVELYKLTSPQGLIDFFGGFDTDLILGEIPWNYNVLSLLEKPSVNRDIFQKFISRVILRSRDNARVFFGNTFQDKDLFGEICSYFFAYEGKSLIDFIKKFGVLTEFNIGTGLLEELNLFGDIDIDDTCKLQEQHNSLLKRVGIFSSKRQSSFVQACVSKEGESINKLFGKALIEYFNSFYTRKIKNRLKIEFGIDIEIPEERINNPLVLEVYKMCLDDTKPNVTQAKQFLKRYLCGDFDDIHLLAQYNDPKNQQWLEDNLTLSQRNIWLSENSQEYIVGEGCESGIDFDQRKGEIQRHFETAIQKIVEINSLGFEFETNFTETGNLEKYFSMVIKKSAADIKAKEGNLNLFQDLEFQVQELKKLKHAKTHKNVKKESSISIHRELDPMKCMMMGNWVRGSCLSFYSPVGNNWSCISNTIDVNKGVYYIKNQDGEILGRCILTIGEDGKLSRYSMYYGRDVPHDIDSLFTDYTIEIAAKLGLELNSQGKVENIVCEAWYDDNKKII